MAVLDLGGVKERNDGRAMGRESVARELVLKLEAKGLPRLLTRPQAKEVVDTILEVLEECLLAGKRIEFRGFGSFRTHRKNPRKTYVPSKKGRVKVDARWLIKFETSKEVKVRLMEHLEE